MPFYEYECGKCGHRFDAMLAMSTRDEEEKKLTCPDCGERGPRRLISSFAALSSGGSVGPADCPNRATCDTGG
ncbi:zinc ribbon domain-containing protein [Candidatus Eisenbacteria bacterium]|uniref:Zinc ribbon domain-containing protein n=1 Tax=Eiseniibacteriota bacterium TaxID=2212470 RepID=A0ABV6YLD5_UNCEI